MFNDGYDGSANPPTRTTSGIVVLKQPHPRSRGYAAARQGQHGRHPGQEAQGSQYCDAPRLRVRHQLPAGGRTPTVEFSFRVRLQGDSTNCGGPICTTRPHSMASTSRPSATATAAPAPAAATPVARCSGRPTAKHDRRRDVVRQRERRLPRQRLLLPLGPPGGHRLDPGPCRRRRGRDRHPVGNPQGAVPGSPGASDAPGSVRGRRHVRPKPVPGRTALQRPLSVAETDVGVLSNNRTRPSLGRGTVPTCRTGTPVRPRASARLAGPRAWAGHPAAARGGATVPRGAVHRLGDTPRGRPMNRRLFTALAGAAMPSSSVILVVAAADPQRPELPQSVKDLKLDNAGHRDQRRPARPSSPPRCAARPAGSRSSSASKVSRAPRSRARRSRRPSSTRSSAQQAAFISRPKGATPRSGCSADADGPRTPSMASVPAKGSRARA